MSDVRDSSDFSNVWRLMQSKTDRSVLVAVRGAGDERVEVRRFSLDTFELPLEDALAIYRPVEDAGE